MFEVTITIEGDPGPSGHWIIKDLISFPGDMPEHIRIVVRKTYNLFKDKDVRMVDIQRDHSTYRYRITRKPI